MSTNLTYRPVTIVIIVLVSYPYNKWALFFQITVGPLILFIQYAVKSLSWNKKSHYFTGKLNFSGTLPLSYFHTVNK